MTTTLTPQQLSDYAQQGFLVLPHFFTTLQCEQLIDRAQMLIANFDPTEVKTVFSTTHQRHAQEDYFLESGGDIRFFFEEGALNADGELVKDKKLSINKIGHALHDLDPVFNAFSRSPALAQLSDDLTIQQPLLLQSMYIFKQPYIGGEVTCHQDMTYLYVKEQPVTGLWFALEDATLDNGCLWAIPGGHQHGLKSRLKRTEGGKTTMEIYDPTPWSLENMVPLEVSRGSLIVLHGLVPHMSKLNTSSRSRQAYTLHLMSGVHPYPEDNWLQRPKHLPLRGFNLD